VREGGKRTTATKKTKTTDMYNYKFLKYGSTLYEFFSHLHVRTAFGPKSQNKN